jgi:hypothetical protein
MGIDLKALATSFRETRNEFLPTATLRFDRDQRLFAQLATGVVPPLVRPLPRGLRVGVYEDAGLAWVEMDRYGQPLTFTTPADLRRLEVPGNVGSWNAAVLAFLLALPSGARIVLYWC